MIRLPHISNFTDFSVFERMDGVSLRYVSQPGMLEDPDLILLPGTKNTMDDMQWLRESGMEALILRQAEKKTPIIGICGGFQDVYKRQVRELFAFPAEKQQELMKEMIARGIAEECVIISTCNRTEVYIYTACPGGNFTELQDLVLEFAGAQDVENIGDYIRFYNGSKAVRHLFHVAAAVSYTHLMKSLFMRESMLLILWKIRQKQPLHMKQKRD